MKTHCAMHGCQHVSHHNDYASHIKYHKEEAEKHTKAYKHIEENEKVPYVPFSEGGNKIRKNADD